ncbi:hypothetical protein TYRP_022076 [Tyrophagus putrescentiae]|nr:hypothetical protein TYRP_022076 [Tyrophagus putrescentiae]
MNIIWALWAPPVLALFSLLIAGLLAFPASTVSHYVLLVIGRARNSKRLAGCTFLAYLVLHVCNLKSIEVKLPNVVIVNVVS